MTVVEALAAVMADVQAVAKTDRNQHQKFNFRGIDAVVNAVGPQLRKHGVVVMPNVESVDYQPVQTSTGKPATACRVLVTYRFHGPDGDHLDATVAGEAWDSGDKACPKAMSVAFRTALLQGLALPTDEPDPDSQTFEQAGPVDVGPVSEAIADATEAGVTGDFDATLEWAAQSQQNVEAAVRKIRKAIAEKAAS